MFREATDFRQRYPEVGLNIRSIFFKPLNDETLRKAVNLWSGSYTEAKGKYGDISRWNVSKVTNMSKLFQNQWYFNDDISNWDVGNVTNMENMFSGASAFNQPLEQWNVGNVTNMRAMFFDASNFNQPLEQWNVGNVTNMRSMFAGASAFNQPLANWEREDSTIENVTNMNSMFQGASSFNMPIEKWKVGNVTNMQAMFNHASSFNQPLGGWDVRNVTDMEAMFLDASAFNQPLDQWNVDSVTNMEAMFSGAILQRYPNADNDPRSVFTSTETNTQNSIVFNNKTLREAVFLWVNNRDEAFSLYEDINTWNVSQVTDMNNLFNNRRDFNDDISNWDVSNVENMENMFFNASSFDQNIGRWDVSKVTNMDSMFKGATSFNQNINTKIASRTNYIYGNEPVSIESYIAWDVSKVTNMNSMFERAISFNQDMTGFNVNNDVTMIKMFSESPLQNEYTATPTKEQFIGIKIKSYYPKFKEKTIEENRQYFKYKHKNNFDIGMLYNGDIVSFIENNLYDINELKIEGGIKSIDDLIEMDKRDESVSYASISKEFFHVKIFYEFVKNLNPSDNEFMIDGLITYLCFEFINYIQNPVFLLYLKFNNLVYLDMDNENGRTLLDFEKILNDRFIDLYSIKYPKLNNIINELKQENKIEFNSFYLPLLKADSEKIVSEIENSFTDYFTEERLQDITAGNNDVPIFVKKHLLIIKDFLEWETSFNKNKGGVNGFLYLDSEVNRNTRTKLINEINSIKGFEDSSSQFGNIYDTESLTNTINYFINIYVTNRRFNTERNFHRTIIDNIFGLKNNDESLSFINLYFDTNRDKKIGYFSLVDIKHLLESVIIYFLIKNKTEKARNVTISNYIKKFGKFNKPYYDELIKKSEDEKYNEFVNNNELPYVGDGLNPPIVEVAYLRDFDKFTKKVPELSSNRSNTSINNVLRTSSGSEF